MTNCNGVNCTCDYLPINRGVDKSGTGIGQPRRKTLRNWVKINLNSRQVTAVNLKIIGKANNEGQGLVS